MKRITNSAHANVTLHTRLQESSYNNVLNSSANTNICETFFYGLKNYVGELYVICSLKTQFQWSSSGSEAMSASAVSEAFGKWDSIVRNGARQSFYPSPLCAGGIPSCELFSQINKILLENLLCLHISFKNMHNGESRFSKRNTENKVLINTISHFHTQCFFQSNFIIEYKTDHPRALLMIFWSFYTSCWAFCIFTLLFLNKMRIW